MEFSNQKRFAFCAEERIKELQNRLIGFRIKRLKNFSTKYSSERKRLHELLELLKTFREEVNSLYTLLLEVTIAPSKSSEAVIVSILENSVTQKKKKIDSLFAKVESQNKSSESSFKTFQYCIKKFEACYPYNNSDLPALSEMEGMLEELRGHRVSIHERVSTVHEECFQFLCSFGDVAKKIKTVIDRAKVSDIHKSSEANP